MSVEPAKNHPQITVSIDGLEFEPTQAQSRDLNSLTSLFNTNNLSRVDIDSQAKTIKARSGSKILSKRLPEKLAKKAEIARKKVIHPVSRQVGLGHVWSRDDRNNAAPTNCFKAFLYERYGNLEADNKIALTDATRTFSRDSGDLIEETYTLEGGGKGSESIKRIATKEKRGWVKSQEFRDLVEMHGFLDARKLYSRDRPVNLRIQTMKTGDKTVGRLGRLGAITDPTLGWYSLETLEKLQKSNDLREKEITRILTLIDNPKPQNFIEKIIQRLKREKPYYNWDQHDSAHFACESLESDKIEATIKKRKEALENQMLIYLESQLDAQEEIPKDNRFNLFHLSLLNLETMTLDRSGWCHNEKVAFEDFRQMMKEFRGKKIHYGETRRIERDTIYLPLEVLKNKDPISLDTFIFNVSPQGHTKNDGLQREHNGDELKRLLDSNPDLRRTHSELIERLTIGKSSGYSLAEDFGLLLHDLALEKKKGAFGLNCASGKDRTGFVAARLMQRKLSEAYPDQKNPHEKRILDKESTATRVAKDNLPSTKALKIHPVTALKDGIPGTSRAHFFIKVLPRQIRGH